VAQFTAAKQFAAHTAQFIVEKNNSPQIGENTSKPIGHGAVHRSKTIYYNNHECCTDPGGSAPTTFDTELGYEA